MGHMGENNSLINCTKHMFLIMVSSQAYKGSLCQWIFVGAVQEWKEDDIVVLRLDRSYPLIGDIVYGASVFFRFCFFITHKIADEPLHISGRCRAALLDQIISRHTEQRIQCNCAVCHRFFRNILVDTPGSGHHTHLFFIRKSGCDSACVDIKHTCSYRDSLRKTGLLTRFFCHMSTDIGSVAKRWKLVVAFFQIKKLHQFTVMFVCDHIDKI